MSDYKYEIQMIAEELADQAFGREYYDLSPDTRCDLYERAQQIWIDKRTDYADLRKKGE